MYRKEFLHLNLYQNNLVSIFKIVHVCSLYNYIGIPKVWFVVYGTNFLFPIGLIIFVEDGNKMIMDYVNHFLGMKGDWKVRQNGREKECRHVTCLSSLMIGQS